MSIRRLMFLLGSGISIDACIPDVAKISSHVRSGDGVFLGPDRVFHLAPENPNCELRQPPVEPTLEFIRTLDQLAREYYDAFELEASSTFSVGDLVDLPSLANKLKQPTRTFDTWLAAQLSSTTQAALANYQGQGSDAAPIQKALLQDLNRVLCGDLIYEQQRFAGVSLRSETQTLMSQNPQGSDLQRLNRLLIEDAYPLEVSRNQLERVVDYEELAFLACQVERAVDLSLENPAVFPLIRQIAASSCGGDIQAFGKLAKQARDYIHDVTWEMLRSGPTRTDHLAAIMDACHEVKCVDLFTLNHDVVLEEAMKRAKPSIAFSDGFEREYGDLRIWNDTFTTGNVRLFKLHGSISWWGYQLPSGEQVTARVTNGDPHHAQGPDGKKIGYPRNDMRPVFLTGTFDKIFGYESWLFPDQHYRFKEALRESNRMAIIGYGFRDQAINNRLIQWLNRSKENKIVVVHGEPTAIPNRARQAVRNHWQEWLKNDRIRVISQWVADTTCKDIIGAICK